MPNYGLVVTPQYNPMSYEQYIQPFKDYAQVYNATADQIDALEMEANQWERLADSDIDAPQYQQYKSYADDLRNYANEIATQGLSSKTRAGLSRMKQRYAKEIKPIEDAYNRREEERKAQRDARMKNPYIRFNRDAASTGLGAYMAGTPEYESVDLAQIKANVIADAKPLADELRDLRSGKLTDSLKWRTILSDQYYEAAKRKGFTSDAINEAISSMLQDPRTTPEQFGALNTIVNGAVESSGVTGWDLYNNNDAFRREVMQAATSGLWQAVGQTDFEHLANRNWDLTHRSSEPTPPPVKLWDWIGKDVDVNGTNREIRQSADDLDFLQRVMQNGVPEEKIKGTRYPNAYNELNVIADRMKSYADKATQEARINGIEWNPETDASYRALYVDFERAMTAAKARAAIPNMPALTQVETITDNPDYKRFIDLQKKYGVTDPTELYNAHHNAHNGFIKVNKYTVLNNTVGTRVMRYLGNQVTSGMNDETLNEVIWQENKKGKKTEVTPETARKALSSKDSTIQVNFNNGKVRINNTEMGTFYLDKSAFHNLTIPVVVEASTPVIIKQMLGIDVNGTAGVIPGDTYIDNVVQLQQYMRNAGYSEDQIDTATNEFIENFYTHLEANTRNMTPESPVTSSKL